MPRLLQEMYSSISMILQTDDVLSVHELHIWQLSDTKMVASLHVLLASTANYMTVAKRVRNLMHKYGIHSITIQPEFVDPEMSEELVKHNQGACAQPNVPAHKRMQPRPWWSKLLPWGKKTEQPVDEENQIENDSVSAFIWNSFKTYRCVELTFVFRTSISVNVCSVAQKMRVVRTRRAAPVQHH